MLRSFGWGEHRLEAAEMLFPMLTDPDNAEDIFALFGTPTSASRLALYERLGVAALIQPLNLTAHYSLDLSFQLDYIVARMLHAAYVAEIASGACDPSVRTDFGGPLQQCWRNVEMDGNHVPYVDPAVFQVRSFLTVAQPGIGYCTMGL
jgi:hypothetical protein